MAGSGDGALLKAASSPWLITSALVAFSSAVLVALFWPTAASIAKLWFTNVTYSHGVLVIPGSLYLAWTRRERLRSLKPEPAFWALPMIALLSIAWLLGKLSATDVVQQLSLAALIVVTIWGIVGTAAARALMFPLSFLLFAVPVGVGLIPALQAFSAWFAVELLDLSGVPVVLEGYFITVPFGKWAVAEACSGIRTLIACFVMGFLYAGLAYRTWGRRLSFLAASVIVPILANGARIYGIVLIGYLSGNPLAAAADHILYGWLFTMIVMVPLLVVGQRWREPPPTRPGSATGSPAQIVPAARTAPAVAWSSPTRHSALFVFLACMTAALAPAYAELARDRAAEAESLQLRFPEFTGEWRAADRDPYGWRPRFAAPSDELNQTYVRGNQFVRLSVAYFDARQAGAKLVTGENTLYDRAHWQRVRDRYVVATCDGRPFRAKETSLRSADLPLVVWSWYWVDGTCTGNEYKAKFLLAVSRLFGSRQGAAAVAVATIDQRAPAPAAGTLLDFVGKLPLQESLRTGKRPTG